MTVHASIRIASMVASDIAGSGELASGHGDETLAEVCTRWRRERSLVRRPRERGAATAVATRHAPTMSSRDICEVAKS